MRLACVCDELSKQWFDHHEPPLRYGLKHFLKDTLSNIQLKDTNSITLIVRYHCSQATATETVCSTQSGARTPCVPCKVPNLNSRLFVFGVFGPFDPIPSRVDRSTPGAGTYGNRPATTRDPPHLIRYRNREHLSSSYPFICFRVT